MTQGRGRRIETALPDMTRVSESHEKRTARQFGHPTNRMSNIPGVKRLKDFDDDQQLFGFDPSEHNKKVEEEKKRSRENLKKMKKTAGLEDK
jgi:hypothetical protein